MKIRFGLRPGLLGRVAVWTVIAICYTPTAFAWFPGEPVWRGHDKYNEVLAQLQKAIPQSTFNPVKDSVPQTGGLRGLFSRKNQPKLENHKLNEQAQIIRETLVSPKESPRESKDPRSQYRTLLRAIRTGNQIIQKSKSGSLDAGLINLFRTVTHALYTKVDLNPFNDRLVCAVSEQGRKNSFNSPQSQQNAEGSNSRMTYSPANGFFSNSLRNFDYAQRKVDLLSKVFERVRANPQILFFQRWAHSLKGEFTYGGLDPNMEANLISVKNRFLRDDNTEHLALRFPSQTIGSSSSATITPEFKAYLDGLGSKKHTYVSFQNIRDDARGKKWAPFLFSDERHRARALHNFSENQSNLVLITLSKNSAFHSQKGKSVISKMNYDDKTSFEKFKEELLNQLVPEKDEDWKKTGIRIGDLWNPEKWSPEDFGLDKRTPPDSPFARAVYKMHVRKKFARMIDTLGSSLGFAKRADLTASERRGFIELTYDLVSDYASRSSVSSNKTCKDAIDRGGGANALTYLTTSLRQMCEDPRAEATFEKTLDALPGVLFSDALQTRKRAIIHERLESFQEAAGVLLRGLKTKGCGLFTEGCKDGKGDCLRNEYTFNKIAPNRKSIEIQPKDTLLQNQNCKHTETEDAPLACGTNISFPIQLEAAASFDEIGRSWNLQQGGEAEDDEAEEDTRPLARY